MKSSCLRRSLLYLSRHESSKAIQFHTHLPRRLQTRGLTSDVESKYKEKLARVAQEKGLSIDEIKSRAQEKKAQEFQKQKEDLAKYRERRAIAQSSASGTSSAPKISPERKDSSPVKPLSSFFNLQKIMSTPHTAEQITALWSAYHASKSNGTGRGYVYATIPVDKYKKMLDIAQRYSSFIVPIPRPATDAAEPQPADQSPYEFFFLQWGLHEAPPAPSAEAELDKLFQPRPSVESPNPPLSTILLTPLQEYKLRQTFATPFLVLTHYTDLVSSHGIVLLRGEITPSSTSVPGADPSDGGRFLLSQLDAQALALSVQKFYLWGSKDSAPGKGEQLLKTFHERPEEFKWEDLLAYTKETSP